MADTQPGRRHSPFWRTLLAILLGVGLGIVWLYVTVLLGLGGGIDFMPVALARAFEWLTPVLLLGGVIVLALGWSRRLAAALFGVAGLLLLVALAFEGARVMMQDPEALSYEHQMAQTAREGARQVIECDNGEMLLVREDRVTSEEIAVLQIQRIRADGRLDTELLASTGVGYTPTISEGMRPYLDGSVECNEGGFSSAGEVLGHLEAFIQEHEPRHSSAVVPVAPE
ncbi:MULTISPECIES: hypothetical protein [unclassified Thioalkalivibrio]|uniref:hypothetical protein n=1 Tax=unclassified Thioalkalivibrio TaxID=2621013 RepID=UPI00036F9AC3|nr:MULTISPECIES: hypothetical protein [unclassified Thioalkalivibrio]